MMDGGSERGSFGRNLGMCGTLLIICVLMPLHVTFKDVTRFYNINQGRQTQNSHWAKIKNWDKVAGQI